MAIQLDNFDIEGFLAESWQKKPHLIRSGWKSWSNPLDPDELAGLACQSDVESRSITHGSRGWKLEHGPLPASRFGQIGKIPWTLLVQSVDHHVPAVAALLEAFRFIPNWRIDDVMVSYAVEGGGVGPHFDQYDVFLLQGLGRRRWRLGGQCDVATELLPHDDLRLLASFDPVEEWVLEPGDILYIPPRIAHDGIAVSDDCMTYSIGFRAPSRSELIAHWSESAGRELHDDDRYADPNLRAQENPGEITPAAIDQLHAMITERMLDRGAFAHWFGRYSTTPKNPDIDWSPVKPIGAEAVSLTLAENVPLVRNPASRFSFIREQAGSLSLFVDGECYECTGRAAVFAEQICVTERVMPFAATTASKRTMDLIVKLINQGSIAFDLED